MGCGRRLLLALAYAMSFAWPALATQRFGPVELSGNLQSQNLVRTPDASTLQYVQNRNTVHLRLDYDWLQGGTFMSQYSIPFVESSHLSVVYRGVYDSIYDTTPDVLQKSDIRGRAYGGMNYFDYATRVGFPTPN